MGRRGRFLLRSCFEGFSVIFYHSCCLTLVLGIVWGLSCVFQRKQVYKSLVFCLQFHHLRLSPSQENFILPQDFQHSKLWPVGYTRSDGTYYIKAALQKKTCGQEVERKSEVGLVELNTNSMSGCTRINVASQSGETIILCCLSRICEVAPRALSGFGLPMARKRSKRLRKLGLAHLEKWRPWGEPNWSV